MVLVLVGSSGGNNYNGFRSVSIGSIVGGGLIVVVVLIQIDKVRLAKQRLTNACSYGGDIVSDW
jgi:hypothetical protein